MFKIIAVTNRKLCTEDFLTQIENVAKTEVAAIILREKDLSDEEYKNLAKQIKPISDKYGVECILHSHIEAVSELGETAIHLPLPVLLEHQELREKMNKIGVSVHSKEEAAKAYEAGAAYVVAGHVYQTDCKKGVPPRGIFFLREVVDSVPIPVYAIGGIRQENFKEIAETGAAGACMMSSFMRNIKL